MLYQIGDVVEALITGIQPYGAFVLLPDYTQGLLHISEISDGYVNNIESFVNLNKRIRLKIIDYDPQTHQARVSLKAIASRRKKESYYYGSLPPMKIGFNSVKNEMQKWLEKAKEKYKI